MTLLAKAFDTISEMTQTGTAIGTPYYMSPEQAKGKEVDWRSDLYSLGVVLFQLLTGEVPFQGDSAVSVGIKHLTDPIPKIPEYLQPTFQVIIEKMMAKAPEDRYQNGGDIVAVLNTISDEQLAEISEPFSENENRENGQNIDHKVATPFPGGTSAIQPNIQTLDSNTGTTKIIDLSQASKTSKNASKNTSSPSKTIIATGIAGSLLLAGVAGYLFFPSDKTPVGTIPSKTIPSKTIPSKTIPSKTIPSDNTNIPQASSSSSSTLRSGENNSTLTSQQTQQNSDNTKSKTTEELAREEENRKSLKKLSSLLKEAKLLEQQLATNVDVIDELHQKYQLISLLQNDHPDVIDGINNIRTIYLNIIQDDIKNKQYERADKALNKYLRKFPDNVQAEHILAIRARLDKESQLAELLSIAKQYLASNNLTGKGENNAYYQYNKILAIEGEHEKAAQGIIDIGEKYHQLASSLVEEEKYQQALIYIDRGLKIVPRNSGKLIALQDKINLLVKQIKEQKQAKEKKQKKVEELLFGADLQLQTNNILPPSDNNALSMYQQVLTLEPDNNTALTAVKDIDQSIVKDIPAHISSHDFVKAQQAIDSVLKHFPKSQFIDQLQLKLNTTITESEEAAKPKILVINIKGDSFSEITTEAVDKFSADRTIYIGLKYTNFGEGTSVLQALLFAGSRTVKISTVPVILSKNEGDKFFRISRPVNGFADGTYFLDLILKNQKITTIQFSIEN